MEIKQKRINVMFSKWLKTEHMGYRQGYMISFRLLGVSIDKCIRFTYDKEGCWLET